TSRPTRGSRSAWTTPCCPVIRWWSRKASSERGRGSSMNSQLPPAGAPLTADYVDVAELRRTINHLKWRVLGVMGVFLVVGILVAFTSEPIYRGSVTLLLEARPSHAVQVQEVYDPGYQSDEYFETQTALLQSRDLIGRVVDQLKLA